MDKSIPYYFEPAPPVQYNGISRRLLEQCNEVLCGDTFATTKKFCMIFYINKQFSMFPFILKQRATR
jgi:hypothetical protein